MVLSTIFFDFGGTLAEVPAAVERPWRVWLDVSREFDLHLSSTLVQHAIEATNEELGPRIYQYVGRTREYWQLYDRAVMDRLRIPAHREEILEGVQAVFEDPSKVRLFPETLEVLENLRSRDYHLGLVSNHHDGLLKILEFHGLNKLLETVTYSQEVGAEKPAPEVFSKALERAHCFPHDALHVGDSLRIDVEGAQKSGIQAVWLNRHNDPTPVDCLVIHTLSELPHVLDVITGAVGSPP